MAEKRRMTAGELRGDLGFDQLGHEPRHRLPTGPATPDPRQRNPTTNHGPAATRPVHISLTARRAQHRRTATDPADHRRRTQAPTRQYRLLRLTNSSPYQ